jgi:methenyltetrahydromethanopterin cyclohydrolase
MASAAYGEAFPIFEQAGHDTGIDPPWTARRNRQNLDTGNVHAFGKIAPDVLRKSFGLP